MLTYVALKDGGEIIAVCLEASDLIGLQLGHSIEIPLSDITDSRSDDPEVAHLRFTTIGILGPGSTEVLLKTAEDAQGKGIDVSITDKREPGTRG